MQIFAGQVENENLHVLICCTVVAPKTMRVTGQAVHNFISQYHKWEMSNWYKTTCVRIKI